MAMGPAQGLQSARTIPSLEGAAVALTWVAMILALTLSSLMLARFGISYEEAGGPAWQKIHPSLPVALAALALLALSRVNPFLLVDDILARQPGAVAFIVMLMFATLYVVWRGGGPVTQFFDTFLMPWALFLLLSRWPETRLSHAALFFHAFMAVNAVIGLGEFALGTRITPLIAEGEILIDWRSTALLGHPLLNAAAAACYAFMLLIGGGRDLSFWVRVAAFSLQAAAMVVFGGRAATVLLIVFALPVLAAAVWRYRGTYRMTPAEAGTVVIVASAGICVVAGLAYAGFFDRFAGRFVDDGGSAAARSSMFEVIWALSPQMLWFGSDPEYVASLQRQVGIPFGIESFWVAMIAYQGLLISIPFFALFLLFLNDYRRWMIPGAAWSIVQFLLIISTSTSLSSKTAMLTVYTIAACLLLRPWRRREG